MYLENILKSWKNKIFKIIKCIEIIIIIIIIIIIKLDNNYIRTIRRLLCDVTYNLKKVKNPFTNYLFYIKFQQKWQWEDWKD